jgi:hypothetical protein
MTVRFDASVSSADMVGKQGVTAPVLVASSWTAVLYTLATASSCKHQPALMHNGLPIINAYFAW